MQIIFRILLVIMFIGVPCGTHAAKKDLTDNVTYSSPQLSFGAADDNDTELYDILTGNEPTLGPLIIGGTGDSWLELLNNTSLVDDITGKYGIRFSNGVLQQIINGTPSSIGSGGSVVTTQAADPTVGDATGFYLSTGTTKFWYRDDGVGTYDFGTYAFTADPACTGTGIIGNKAGTPSATNPTYAFTQRYVAGTDTCVTLGGIEHAAGLGGTAVRLTVHANNGGVPGALLYTSNELIASNVNEIEEVTFPSAFQITNGVTYWLGYVADASFGYIYSTSTGEAYYFNDSYVTYPTPDDPFVGTLSGTTTRVAILYLEDI